MVAYSHTHTCTCIQSLSWAYVMFKVMLCVHLLSAYHIHIPTCIHSDSDSMGGCIYVHLATHFGIYIHMWIVFSIHSLKCIHVRFMNSVANSHAHTTLEIFRINISHVSTHV